MKNPLISYKLYIHILLSLILIITASPNNLTECQIELNQSRINFAVLYENYTRVESDLQMCLANFTEMNMSECLEDLDYYKNNSEKYKDKYNDCEANLTSLWFYKDEYHWCMEKKANLTSQISYIERLEESIDASKAEIEAKNAEIERTYQEKRDAIDAEKNKTIGLNDLVAEKERLIKDCREIDIKRKELEIQELIRNKNELELVIQEACPNSGVMMNKWFEPYKSLDGRSKACLPELVLHETVRIEELASICGIQTTRTLETKWGVLSTTTLRMAERMKDRGFIELEPLGKTAKGVTVWNLKPVKISPSCFTMFEDRIRDSNRAVMNGMIIGGVFVASVIFVIGIIVFLIWHYTKSM